MNHLHDILAKNWNSIATEPTFSTGAVPPSFFKVLTTDYLAAVREFGGREGFLGTQYLRLYRLEELADLNSAYGIPALVPEIVLFGTDGGEEAFGFMLRNAAVIQIPFIPLLLENASVVSPTFTEFINTLNDTGPSLVPDLSLIGMQQHAIHPIALGGSPTASENRVMVTLQKHAELTQFWNRVYIHARSQSENNAS